MTWLEVVDSAVKIGLGALIAGGSTFLIGFYQHRRELEKERIKREFEMLKQVAEQVEAFTHVALTYWALIVEWGRVKRSGNDLAPAREAALDASITELFASYRELTSAESKLLLLGLKDAQSKARQYGDEVKALRREVHREAKPLTEEQAAARRSRLLNAREALFDELNRCYQQLSK